MAGYSKYLEEKYWRHVLCLGVKIKGAQGSPYHCYHPSNSAHHPLASLKKSRFWKLIIWRKTYIQGVSIIYDPRDCCYSSRFAYNIPSRKTYSRCVSCLQVKINVSQSWRWKCPDWRGDLPWYILKFWNPCFWKCLSAKHHIWQGSRVSEWKQLSSSGMNLAGKQGLELKTESRESPLNLKVLLKLSEIFWTPPLLNIQN